MERKADPLRTRVAHWLARTELRIEVQGRAPAPSRREGEFLPLLDDKQLLSELRGVVAVAEWFARDESPLQRALRHACPTPGRPPKPAPEPWSLDDHFPERCRGVSITAEFLAGLLAPS